MAGSSNSFPIGQSRAPVIFATDFHAVTSGAIRNAACCASMMNAPLHCLHVLPDLTEGVAQRSLVHKIMIQALRYIYAEQVSSVSGCICAVIYGGEVSRAVIGYAREQQAQLIVLGILHSSPRPRGIAARTATRVISNASCPVLTVAYGLTGPSLSKIRKARTS